MVSWDVNQSPSSNSAVNNSSQCAMLYLSSHCCVCLCTFRVEKAVSSSSGDKDDPDPALSTAIADLHKFSMMQSMYKSAVHLLEDLSSHSKLLHMPERAQVLLAATQNPLLGEHHFAKALLPRLCSIILGAHKATRHVSEVATHLCMVAGRGSASVRSACMCLTTLHRTRAAVYQCLHGGASAGRVQGFTSYVVCIQLLVKWWSDYPAELLEQRVVAPMQSYLTKELMATKKLTIGVMNAIKVCQSNLAAVKQHLALGARVQTRSSETAASVLSESAVAGCICTCTA